MRALVRLLAAASAAAVFVPALAWTGPTRVRMVDDAVLLMPPTLRTVLEHRRESILAGMLTPMTSEDDAGHRPPWDKGTLDASVDAAAAELVKAVNARATFDEVARRFGALAHYVADSGFPPGAAGSPGAARYGHFASFCETRRGRFPLVFYGYESLALAKGDFKAFALESAKRSRDEDATLAAAYAAAPDWNDPASFDDRSVPFAIASLSYSHAVTDIAQAWVAAWRRCNGDLGGTPYLHAKPAAPPAGAKSGTGSHP